MPAPEYHASPQPKIDPPRHDTREEMRAVVDDTRKAKRRRPVTYGLLGTLLATALGGGGYGAVKAQTSESKLSARLDERSRGQQRELDRHEKAIEALEQESKSNAVFRAEQRAVNRVLLDALKVPKSKRPKLEDEEEGP